MARDAAFWRWYAAANDDIRHEVIERGWYQRQTTADIDAQDMPGMIEHEPTEPQDNPHQGTVWEQENMNGVSQAPAIEPPQPEQD